MMTETTTTTTVTDAPQVTVDAGVPPAHALRATLRGVSAVVGPTTMVLALLYYFGWVRTSYQAHRLGLDDSLLGYSTQDYVLRSISSLEGPLTIGAAAVLLALGAHRALLSWIDGHSERADERRSAARQLQASAGALGAVAFVLVVLGVLGARVKHPSRFVSLWAPLSLAIGIALLSYAVHVYNRYVPTLQRRGRARLPSKEVAGLNLFAAGVMSALLLLTVLRAVSHYAAIRGIELAAEAERVLPSQPDVTIYSAKQLELQPPVVETKIGDADAAYRYQYTGLKLLFRSERRFFLRPADTSDTRNIILADSDDVRLEFASP